MADELGERRSGVEQGAEVDTGFDAGVAIPVV
jgi:hypothetical protein